MDVRMSNVEIDSVKGIKIKLSLEFNTNHNIVDYAELETISKDMQEAFKSISDPLLAEYGKEVAKSLLGLSGDV